jgi:hypothetical protein
LLSPGAALALTAEEAWDSWRDAAARSGVIIDVENQRRSTGQLALYGVNYLLTSEDLTVRSALGDITLIETGDGAVRFELPAEYIVLVGGPVESGGRFDAMLEVTAPDMALEARDAEPTGADSSLPGAVAYTYSAPQVDMALTRLVVDGAPMEGTLTAALRDVSGTHSIGASAEAVVSSTLAAGQALLDMDFANPDAPGRARMALSVADVSSTSRTTGEGAAEDDLSSMLMAGFATEGTVLHGPATFEIGLTGDEHFDLSGSAREGGLSLALDRDALDYRARQSDLAITLSGSSVPLPEVALGFAELDTTLAMPLTPTEAPEPVQLTTALRGLTVSDGVWNLFDPGEVLPREPATVALSLSGTARWLVDMFDSDAVADAGEASQLPAEITALSVDELLVDAIGATLSGAGSFTFDNSDMESFPGMPAPEGTLSLSLIGGNALLDNLTLMGFVPSEQAMGIRLMTGMFTRPGDGPDALVSEITINEQGHVLANGQRIK